MVCLTSVEDCEWRYEDLLDQKLNSRLNAIAEDKLPSIYDLKLENNSLRPPIEGLPIYLGFQCEACEKFFLSQSTFQRNHKGCSKVRAVSTVLSRLDIPSFASAFNLTVILLG